MNDKPRRSSNNLNRRGTSGDYKILGESGRKHKPDYWILILSVVLLSVGLVVVYSISPGLAASQNVSQNYFITKQIIDVGLGLMAFAVAAFLPTKIWFRATIPLVVAAILASIIVMFTPVDAVYQAHRWIRFAGISFQVAELIKLAVLIGSAGFLARQWSRGRIEDFNGTLKPLLVMLIIIASIVAKLQSDLGSTAVIVMMLGMMAFVAGIPLKRALVFGAVVLAIGLLAISTSSYRRERFATYLSPETNCQDSGYQACQALISVGSGGVFGLGLGHSVQAYGYLPEASDDSIFAIMAEKFGFIGTASIVIIYGVFISRLKKVIERTVDQFNRLIVVGVLAWLSTQMVINVGAMVGLLPIKGITLPLISQGGTSLVFLTAALGIVFNISRYTSYNVTEPRNNSAQNLKTSHSLDGRGVRRAYNASAVSRSRP
ncbi:cell division protein FtsW [Candidatus Saccharibacteria bacterium]|nr:cell division protein FtsW [Candidatus Saccharibacteria bacterium]